MISEDVFALVQLDPPGIELCRISNMTIMMTGGSDGSQPHMDKLCTLLLPPLQDGARPDWAVCVGEHPGHQPFSRGPWPEYRRAPSRRQFRQSTRDSIVSVVMQITGSCREARIFDLVVRCATLLAHAAADTDAVPWAEWGPRSTSMSDHTSFEWSDLLGERRATVDHRSHQIRIYDYNTYRIRQARTAGVAATGDHRQVGDEGGGVLVERRRRGDSDEEVEEGNRYHRSGSRRITEESTILGGEWFREDVWTALPHLDMMIYKPGCKAIYMEQDQLLVQVNDYLDDVSGDEDDDYSFRADDVWVISMAVPWKGSYCIVCNDLGDKYKVGTAFSPPGWTRDLSTWLFLSTGSTPLLVLLTTDRDHFWPSTRDTVDR